MRDDLSFRRILVPLDGSENSLKAARFALRLARKEGGTVVAVHVVDEENAADLARYADCPQGQIVARMQRSGEGYLDTVRQWAEGQGVSLSGRVLVGVPHRAILKLVTESGVDLVVMGSVGRRGPRRVLIGSVTERVIAHSTIPVLVVK